MSCSFSKYTPLFNSIIRSFTASLNSSLCSEPIRDRVRDCGQQKELNGSRTHISASKDRDSQRHQTGRQLVLTSLMELWKTKRLHFQEWGKQWLSVCMVGGCGILGACGDPYLRSGGRGWPHSAPDPPATNTAELSGWRRMSLVSHGKKDHSPAREKTHAIITKNI